MVFKFFFLGLILLVSITAFAGISGQLMQKAATHEGHKKLETHSFISTLKNATFDQTQVSQFFIDRVYVLRIMEDKVFPEKLDFDGMDPQQKIFFRSISYYVEYHLLTFSFPTESFPFSPSEAAIQYGNYLKDQRPEAVSVHMWLFLMGETFGTQSMGSYIQNKYSKLGETIRNFENLSLITVRGIYNRWIDSKLTNVSIDLDKEIDIGFSFMISMFDASEKETNPSVCTIL